MGNTRRTLSTSHKLSLIVLCTSLSCSALAAPPDTDASATRPNSDESPLFTAASRWVLGLEGLVALEYQPGAEDSYVFTDAEGQPVEVRTSSDSLLLSSLAPRVGLDAFVADSVSVGLAAQYSQATSDTETRTAPGETTQLSSTSRMLRLTPRVGVAYTSRSGFGIWARGGLDLTNLWREGGVATLSGDDGRSSAQILGVSATALATFTPRPDIVLGAGPFVGRYVASNGYLGNGSPPEENPAAFGLTFGAGLVL